MAYHIDEENSEIVFEVKGDKVILKYGKTPSGGGGGESVYLIKKGDSTTPTDNNTFSALRILAELLKNNEELKNLFISSVSDDEAAGLLTFLKGFVSHGLGKALGGLEVGEAIKSLIAGKGTIIDANGHIEADRMVLRSSLTVLRLIINDLQAMAGDYSFSDCGCIERVEQIDDNTYKLWMEKRTDTDWTNLDVHDVMFSIVNRLLLGGTDYYTSWFRCVTKNRNDNTLTVVLYPDSEVPGNKNYPPAEGYNVTRRGNAIIPDAGQPANERAQSWMISSREGRIMFLQNVFKPILEESNHSIVIGKLPKLKALESLPLSDNDTGIFAKNIIAENFYQADWNGDIIPKKVDRGEWSLDTAKGASPYRFITHEVLQENQSTITQLEQHEVGHDGCTWGCLIDKTLLEPGWNCPGWSFLRGDPNYYLYFSVPGSSYVRINQVDLTVTAWVKYANRNITDVLMAADGTEVEWLRKTGNTPADNRWKPTYVDGQRHVIQIDNSDEHGIGRGFGIEYRAVEFICQVFIPIGGEIKEVKKSIGFKIK